MNRERTALIEKRTDLIRELAFLGLSIGEIAEATRENRSTVWNDIRKLGGLAAISPVQRSNERSRRILAFQKALERYAQLLEEKGKKEGKVSDLECALARWLRIPEVNSFVCGVSMTIQWLCIPGLQLEKRPYLKLLGAIFGYRPATGYYDPALFLKKMEKGFPASVDFHPILQTYLCGIAGGGTQVPSRDSFGSALFTFFAPQFRPEIMPIWTNEAYERIDEVLATLPECEARAVRMHFGIGYDREYTLKEIEESYPVRNRAQTLFYKALRMLRSPGRASHLRCLIEPIGNALEEQLRREAEQATEERRRAETEKRRQEFLEKYGVSCEPAVLEQSIDDIELSVRTYNCLVNANIRTIAELVQRSENEMLKLKNFGRRSLNELKEILASLGLHFGMSFRPENA